MTKLRFAQKSAVAFLALLALMGAACSTEESSKKQTPDSQANSTGDDASENDASGDGGAKGAHHTLIFNAEGNNLNAYEDNGDGTFTTQQINTSHDSDPDGWDINGQICFFPREEDGTHTFIAGEDVGQPETPAGWGIFEMTGERLGEFEIERVGKLTPTYQPALDKPDQHGCGVLPDGRVVSVDIGNTEPPNAATGQLMIWFPPYDNFEVSFCKLDIGIATSGSIYVSGNDEIYVASARPPAEGISSGIWKYSGPFPTSADADGGCGKTDNLGSPLADGTDETQQWVDKEMFIAASSDPDNGLRAVASVVRNDEGHFYVSSVINGVISEFDEDGVFIRKVLEPPAGEDLAARSPESFSTGTPFGIGLDSAGNIYYADLGIVINGLRIGPGPGQGNVRIIRFVDGEPQAPKAMNDVPLLFPDGIGIYEYDD